MITIRMSKLNFFTPKLITSAVDRRKRRAQSKIGAYMRRSARQRLRKRKRSARPGESPSMHVGLMKEFLLFSYDSSSESVVIGPVLLGESSFGLNVPSLMEHGGAVRKKGKYYQYAPHPTMGPTLDKERPNDRLSQAWKDAVTR